MLGSRKCISFEARKNSPEGVQVICDEYPENTGTQYIYLFLVSDSGCLMSEFAPRIDLVAEAKNHIAFLNEVNKSAQLHESQVILNAIRRSGIFLFSNGISWMFMINVMKQEIGCMRVSLHSSISKIHKKILKNITFYTFPRNCLKLCNCKSAVCERTSPSNRLKPTKHYHCCLAKSVFIGK